jgi:uncharacterized membrane protein
MSMFWKPKKKATPIEQLVQLVAVMMIAGGIWGLVTVFGH